jgi:hypothetical protein
MLAVRILLALFIVSSIIITITLLTASSITIAISTPLVLWSISVLIGIGYILLK